MDGREVLDADVLWSEVCLCFQGPGSVGKALARAARRDGQVVRRSGLWPKPAESRGRVHARVREPSEKRAPAHAARGSASLPFPLGGLAALGSERLSSQAYVLVYIFAVLLWFCLYLELFNFSLNESQIWKVGKYICR